MNMLRATPIAWLLALACVAIPLHGQSATIPSELTVLRGIPHTVLDRLSFDAAPDAAGDMQLNRGHWNSVVFQRVAMPLFWVGAAEADQHKVDEAWLAVDAAFRHQQGDGSFASADGSAMRPTDMAFWLQALGHGLLVLRESPLAAQNAGRIAAVLPKIRAAASWLQQRDHLATLAQGDKLGTNRVFVDAGAFQTSGLLLNDSSFIATSNDLLDGALSRETAQGVLPENGGFDSSYQAVSLVQCSYLLLQAPRDQLVSALTVALNRELEVISKSGVVSVAENTRTGRGQEMIYGHPKPVDQRSVILGLYYAGLTLGRPDAIAAAEHVYEHDFHQSPNL